MPELPEVETVRNGLAPLLTQGKIIDIWQSGKAMRMQKMPCDCAQLKQARLCHIERRAKYLLFHFDEERNLLLHLGMSGVCYLSKTQSSQQQMEPMPKHAHLVLGFEHGYQMQFCDPRRFGWYEIYQHNSPPPMLSRLGVEPLSNQFHVDYLANALQGKQVSIKSALLDQSIIAGLGNIYVCEALWQAAISPICPAGKIGFNQLENLMMAIKQVLQKAIEAGGSTLKDFQQSDGKPGYFQHQFNAYGKAQENCQFVDNAGKACDGLIMRIRQSGRSSFYCPIHQLN